MRRLDAGATAFYRDRIAATKSSMANRQRSVDVMQ
jgi:hypothetical protein